uniref:TlpA disulfide reductase family protein n=1 Tax=Pedobacter schmidteae TaxID=2201271 RepID=UPI000EB18EC7|nr:TlpA disulfide reductase family protein [Pedobacter schmidteae]
MKKLIIPAFFLFPVLGWAQNNTYLVKGKFKDANKNGMMYMSYYKGGKTQKDSTMVKNGLFEFKGVSDGPQQVYMTYVNKGTSAKTSGAGRDSRSLYLDRGIIIVNAGDSIKTAILEGAPINADHVKYSAAVDAGQAETMALRKEYTRLRSAEVKDSEKMKALEGKMEQAEEHGKLALVNFVKQNPDSYFCFEALQKIGGSYFDVSKVEPLFNGLSAGNRNSTAGKAFAASIAASKATEVGKMAPEFAQLNTEDKSVKLTDYRGKYVLVDFWASWCGPCRAENPKVLKAYNAFKDKNFTVLGVSVDKDKKQWLKAIKDDGMPWMQLVDPDHDNPKGAGNLYAIKAIPSNFLIDPNGKIIAKNLRGEALEKKLAEVIK